MNPYEKIETQHNLEVYCEVGWADIINEINDKLTKLSPDYQVAQIKEKFGELRYYIESYGENNRFKPQMDEIIDELAKKANETCEICGKPGQLHNYGSYVQTVCTKHQ